MQRCQLSTNWVGGLARNLASLPIWLLPCWDNIYTIFILCVYIYIYHVCIHTQIFAPTFSSTQANIQYMEHLGYVVLPVSILSAISGSARFPRSQGYVEDSYNFHFYGNLSAEMLESLECSHRNHWNTWFFLIESMINADWSGNALQVDPGIPTLRSSRSGTQRNSALHGCAPWTVKGDSRGLGIPPKMGWYGDGSIPHRLNGDVNHRVLGLNNYNYIYSSVEFCIFWR